FAPAYPRPPDVSAFLVRQRGAGLARRKPSPARDVLYAATLRAAVMTSDTINDPRLAEGVWTTDPETGELVPDYESTFPTIEEGQVVNGTVVRVDKDEVLVDIGYKSEGVIPVSELSIRRSINPADEVNVG